MGQVKFLFGATIFEKDGTTVEIDENQVCDIVAKFKRDGYQWLTIVVGNTRKHVIFDSEDMKVIA